MGRLRLDWVETCKLHEMPLALESLDKYEYLFQKKIGYYQESDCQALYQSWCKVMLLQAPFNSVCTQIAGGLSFREVGV